MASICSRRARCDRLRWPRCTKRRFVQRGFFCVRFDPKAGYAGSSNGRRPGSRGNGCRARHRGRRDLSGSGGSLMMPSLRLAPESARAPARTVFRRLPPGLAAPLALSFALMGSGCGSSQPPVSRPAQKPGIAQASPKSNLPTGPNTTAVASGMSGPQLYIHYCAACHGEDGDGQGPAARFLYPKPRDFRAGVFRMVTSANRVGSDADLMRVQIGRAHV